MSYTAAIDDLSALVSDSECWDVKELMVEVAVFSQKNPHLKKTRT